MAGADGANPFAAWRSGPYPMPPGAPMYGATRSAAAAERLGYHPYPAPTAANSVPYGGRPACNNCGFCAFFGCPIHAKGDPVALLQRVMATGRAELRPETFVSRIRAASGRATGVDYIGPDGVERSMDARHVVLAAGAIETPRLLLLSRARPSAPRAPPDGALPDDRGGHHARTACTATGAGRSPTSTTTPSCATRRRVRAARAAGLPWLRGGLVEHGGASLPIVEAKVYPWGQTHKELMADSPMRDRLWAFIMQGEDLPYPTNTIDLDPTVRDVRGFPVARITYRGGRHELAASDHHGPRLEAVLKEMGAGWTHRTSSPGTGRDGMSVVPESRHVMGTARMGDDPATSVVDRHGRLHHLPNVVLADSSVFVTSAGYGPTLTLVALAARAASALAGVGPPAPPA